MLKRKDMLWTWLEGERPRALSREDERLWVEHGGKWIIFDKKKKILDLAKRLEPFIDSGEVVSAKYWNKDPSAICVYCLDSEKEEKLEVLEKLGAGRSMVWEYDYAWDKNIRSPMDFMYSWYSKLTTIIRSYGVAGTIRLIREIMLPKSKP
jgi:hypothetical protein